MNEAELRMLFAQEADILLAQLSSGALELEQGTASPADIDRLFRSAHTLKGSAALVGLHEVSTVTHALEDLLEPLRAGELAPSPDIVDVILDTVDALRIAIPRLLAGEPIGVVDPQLVARLTAAAGRELPDAPRAPVVPSVPVRPPLAEPSAPPAPIPDPPFAGSGPPGPMEEPLARYIPPPPPRPGFVPPPAPKAPPFSEPPLVVDPGSTEATTGPAVPVETVAVPLERLDRLVRLAGEARTARLRVAGAVGPEPAADPDVEAAFADLDRALETLQLQLLQARMITLAAVAEPLQRAVRDVARASGKAVDYALEGERVELDRGVLDALREPLLHLVRNAVDHGIEPAEERVAAGKPPTGTVRVHATRRGQALQLRVTDDGRGPDPERIRRKLGAPQLTDAEALDRLFAPGVSTAETVTAVSGRGVGLDVVRTAVERVRGTVEASGVPGEGTTFTIAVPVSLAVVRCLLVRAGGEHYAIPGHAVSTIVEAQAEALVGLEGGAAVWVGGDIVPLTPLARLLGGTGTRPGADGPAVVIVSGTRRQAVRVDELLGQRDVTLQSLGDVLPANDLIAGASIEADGSVLLVLDPATLMARATDRRGRGGDGSTATPAVRPATPEPATILVVEDALTVRELQRSILERAGYTVVTAADGRLGLAALADLRPDLVLTDIEMPNLDGFGLIEAIRAQPQLASVPVLIMSSREDPEDRARGLQVGADGYIVKQAFDEATLLAAVRRMLGAPSQFETPE